MNSTLAIKFSRLALAISVSVWMAGGCLFGCGNTQAMAAEVAASETPGYRETVARWIVRIAAALSQGKR